MVKNYSALLIFIGLISTSAQRVAWQRDLESPSQNFLSDLSITLDRQFLVSGSSIQNTSASPVSGNAPSASQGYDYHVLKLNQQGNPVWEKYYGGNKHDYLTATVATQEGGFLLGGTSYSSQGGSKKGKTLGGSDAWIIKLNEKGEEEWQKTLGTRYDDDVKAVIQTQDLGYIMAGSIQNPTLGFGSKDAWLVKLDAQGKVLKEIIVGGEGLDEVERIIPTLDGGALVALYSRSSSATHLLTTKREELKKLQEVKPSTASTSTAKKMTSLDNESYSSLYHQIYAKEGESYGEGDYWVIKLDKEGEVQWQKSFGGKEDDHIRSLTSSGKGFLIGGESRSSNSGTKKMSLKEGNDIWILALDENGNELWQKSYSFGNRDILTSINTIWKDEGHRENKGYLLGGFTQAEEKKEKGDETFWMLHITSEGEEVWRKHVEGKNRKNEERLVQAKMVEDGSFILAGTSAQELGQENWKILLLGDAQVQELIEKKDIKIYPNPVEDYCYVEIGIPFKNAEIEIYDMSGKLVQKIKTQNPVTKITTTSLPQGVYIIKANTENKTLNAKIIKR